MKEFKDLWDCVGKTIDRADCDHGQVVIGFTDGTYWAGRAEALRFGDGLDIVPAIYLAEFCDERTYIEAGVMSEDEAIERVEIYERVQCERIEAEEMRIYERVKERLKARHEGGT